MRWWTIHIINILTTLKYDRLILIYSPGHPLQTSSFPCIPWNNELMPSLTKLWGKQFPLRVDVMLKCRAWYAGTKLCGWVLTKCCGFLLYVKKIILLMYEWQTVENLAAMSWKLMEQTLKLHDTQPFFTSTNCYQLTLESWCRCLQQSIFWKRKLNAILLPVFTGTSLERIML